jgi:hypothetical protein
MMLADLLPISSGNIVESQRRRSRLGLLDVADADVTVAASSRPQLRRRPPAKPPRPQYPTTRTHEDMKPGELIAALQSMSFDQGRALLLLDAEVRDYLLAALRRR